MATFDHERAHMAANLVSDPPVARVLVGCKSTTILSTHYITQCLPEDQASYLLSVCNEVSSLEDLGTPHLAILNCSRDPKFIEICSECVNNNELKLRRKICISTGPTHA